MIRVLVVDDSPTARAVLVQMLRADGDIEVVGEARDGLEAVEMARRLRPDVITMDVHMPHMDGFEATREIMIATPTPIVVVTGSLAKSEVAGSIQALRAGALCVHHRPPGPAAPTHEREVRQLLTSVKAMSRVKPTPRARPKGKPARAAARVVAVAASTGGPAALHRLLSTLPGDFPVPILVVQHMTSGFIAGLASYLHTTTAFRVKVADAGEALAPRTVYLAPDDRHLGASPAGSVVISAAPPVGGFRPSGTVLFESVARAFGAATIAVVLTGMGVDGVAGLGAVRQAGGRILVQDEESSVVFGMPGAAVAAGVVDRVLPLGLLASGVVTFATGGIA